MLEGGCACGGLRFRVTEEPRDIGYCHCRICQRTSGAPAIVWATVALASVTLDGEPRTFRSTAFGERWFCPRCGTQIAMRVDHEPTTIDLSVACFEDPARLAPHFHIWISSRVPWFETRDDLPRHARDRTDFV